VPEPALPFWSLLLKDLTVRFVLVYEMSRAAHEAAVAAITTALEHGALRHAIAARFPLDDIAAAHETQESGRPVGKVIVELH
jgi:NADPH2:quinone reductase